MTIHYALEPGLRAAEFRAVLVSSTLGERRPVNEPVRLEQMLRHADVIVTARGERGGHADADRGSGRGRLLSEDRHATAQELLAYTA